MHQLAFHDYHGTQTGKSKSKLVKELLKIMTNNGGKVPYGEVDKLLKKYNSTGFKAITRQNLYYRLSKIKR
jgi:hypothetical protein